jgi:NAD(P)-dependent dehydrogenase (short-subunit alcohol dehydrogenase family)
MSTSMNGKVCIVTGGNTGIGKETARGLARAGAAVVIAARDVAKADAARADIVATTHNDGVSVMPLDLGNTASIRAFADAFRAAHPRLDVLVNNAGLWTRARGTTADGFETTFGVNHLGPFLLTHLLLGRLRASAPARVVNVSSALHYRGAMRWDDTMFERDKFSGMAAYNQSKLANVLFTAALAERLRGTGVTVNAVHPGVVATELARELPRVVQTVWNWFLLSPAQGAATSLHVATAPELDGVTGKYFEKSREKTASKAARDPAAQQCLWELSERLLGLDAARAAA